SGKRHRHENSNQQCISGIFHRRNITTSDLTVEYTFASGGVMNKRGLALSFLLILIVAVTASAQAVNRPAIEKQIIANERAINDAFTKSDMKAFNALVASDAFSVDGGGIMKTSDPNFEKMMKDIKIQSWNIEGSQFYWINDNTVVHMYKWTGK